MHEPMRTATLPPGKVVALTSNAAKDATVGFPLTDPERAEFRSREAVIARGLGTFIEVGKALAYIKAERLYRETHSSFEEYCRDKWEISRNYAHRLVSAAEVCALLPNGNLPESEAQV